MPCREVEYKGNLAEGPSLDRQVKSGVTGAH
jgi:hypothetical protein